MTYVANCTSLHTTFHCGQHTRRREGKKMWEKKDLKLLQRLRVLKDPRLKHTLLRSLVSPLQKQCGSLLSPLQWSENSPLHSNSAGKVEGTGITNIHSGRCQSPTPQRKAPSMRQLSSADAKSQCFHSDKSHMLTQ